MHFTNIIKLRGGSNCSVFRALHKGEELIIKLWGENRLSKELLAIINLDIAEIKLVLDKSGIKYPRTLQTTRAIVPENSLLEWLGDLPLMQESDHSGFSVIEVQEYLGDNVLELSKSGGETGVLEDVYSFIGSLPEEVPLDIHPRNITVHNGTFCLVDFLPPDPIKYSELLSTQSSLKEIFPTLTRDNSRFKEGEFTRASGRKARFDYFLAKMLNS